MSTQTVDTETLLTNSKIALDTVTLECQQRRELIARRWKEAAMGNAYSLEDQAKDRKALEKLNSDTEALKLQIVGYEAAVDETKRNAEQARCDGLVEEARVCAQTVRDTARAVQDAWEAFYQHVRQFQTARQQLTKAENAAFACWHDLRYGLPEKGFSRMRYYGEFQIEHRELFPSSVEAEKIVKQAGL